MALRYLPVTCSTFIDALAAHGWHVCRPDALTFHLMPPEPTVPGVIVTRHPDDGLTYRLDSPEPHYPLEDAAVQAALLTLLIEGSNL